MNTVDAVLIARDEERSIARAVTSVRDYVDRVVVVDTGSTDRTRGLAEDAGAQVRECRWDNDFAAARNEALDLSDADLHLVIDADEWLVEGGDWLDAVRSAGWPAQVGLATVRSSSMADGLFMEHVTKIERLLPAVVRYRGRIHEQPQHDLAVVETPLVFGHDGYEPDRARAKATRNEALLRAELHDRPHDPYLHYQLGKQLQAGERYGDSALAYVRALERAATTAPYRHSLVVRALSVLGKAGEFETALALMEIEGGRWEGSPDYWFAAGNALLDLGLAHPERAREVLPMVEGAWLRCLTIGERPDFEGAVPGRGSWLAAYNLAGYYESLGDHDKARHYRNMSSSQQLQAGVTRGNALPSR